MKKSKFNITKEDLYSEYIVKNNTQMALCKYFNCSKTTIKDYLRLYNIKKNTGLKRKLCIVCDREFKINKFREKTAKYCSNICRYKYYSQFKRGKNGVRYIDGRTKLTKDIRRLIEYSNWRTKVFERDNYTCQECGKQRCYLEAHHVKLFGILFQEFLQEYNQFSIIEDKETLVRLAMNYKPFWDISNGKSLCSKCHNRTKVRKLA